MDCIVHGVAESDTTEQLSLSSHKACGGGNDSCRQERSCGGFCRNKFQTQLTYKKSTETGTFSSHPLGGGKPQMATGQDAQHPQLLQEECQSKQQQDIKFHLKKWSS